MTVSSASAARTICDLQDWSITNLMLQKQLYLAHMIYIGETGGQPLIPETFEAWDYGPVLPSVFRCARVYGADPVRDIFRAPFMTESSQEYQSLEKTIGVLKGKSAAKLVGLTHSPVSAWSAVYRPGCLHIPIPTSEILREYDRRSIRAAECAAE
jgi:uncharacterized phage-associated protein